MSEQELIQAGKSALHAGNTQKATAYFAQLVQQHPQSQQGWYLLGISVTDTKQKEYCFKRTLAINPNHTDAKHELTLLTQPQPVTPPPTFSTPEAKPLEPYQEPTSQPKIKKQVKKKNNKILQNTLIASALIIICTSIIGATILFSGQFTSTVPTQNIPTQTTQTAIPLAPTWTATVTSAPTSIQFSTAMPTIAYTPRFEETTCTFETPARIRVTCGYAIVPESRTSDPLDTIRLAVAIFHSTNNNPAPDPILFLQGGPGGRAIELSANGYETVVEPFIDERDFITYDQRGTGLSTPALQCEELDKVNRQDIYGTIENSTRELVYETALFSCGGLYQSNGINVQAYSTVENAADLRDIVKLLGYQKVNLFGVSYGTRLALVTMRNHPEIVRSAILDSVVPVEMNLLHAYPDSVKSALSEVFETCMLSVSCNTAYPELEKVFWELANKLDQRPITLTTSAYPLGSVTETVDGYYLVSVVLGLTKSSYYINTVPQTIYRVKEGDLTTLTTAQYALPYSFDGIDPGVYISTICREHVLTTSEEELRAVSARLDVDSFVWRPYYGNFVEMYQACKTWGATEPNAGETEAVISDIPSIIIEGAFDSATPPFMGKQVSANLSNSFYFEFPDAGHVPSLDNPDGCAMRVTLAFLENPLVEPDRSCLSEIKPVDYLVPYTGEPAIELETVQSSGLRVNVPKGWYYDEGFFVRYSSPFDSTQVGAFRLDVSVQELNNYFSSSAYGYRGFDGALIEAGEIKANGLTWKLYTTTSNGRPVDIAAVEQGSTSMMIMMFSHADEHDAFYRTLFLPMVNSAR